VNNEATVGTGGVLAYSCRLTLRNNIIWGNLPAIRQTMNAEGGAVQATYCNVQNGLAGMGNLNLDPFMGNDTFQLTGLSPCIDSGDSTDIYEDSEDPLNPGMAKFPSKGTVRNDMGAYGGSGAGITGYIRSGIPSGIPAAGYVPAIELLQNYPNPASDYTTICYTLSEAASVSISITDLSGRIVENCPIGLSTPGKHLYRFDVTGLRQGSYLYCLETRDQKLVRQMKIVR
jgi:hypothetical protein